MKCKNERGFTVIEVSLVLAIAGLIFLMIFIALPALQRTQRDAARRDDIMSFLKEVKSFQTNNRGTLPIGGSGVTNYEWGSDAISNATNASWGGFFRDYLGEDFVDPDGVHYNLAVMKCGAAKVDDECTASDVIGLEEKAFPNNYNLLVVTQSTCYGDKAVGVANPRKIAVLYRLEGAGVYCANT